MCGYLKVRYIKTNKTENETRKELTMALSYEKLNELFTSVCLELSEEKTKKCYDAL